MDAESISRALTRIAHEILERNTDVERLALVGIRNRGVPLANRLAALLAELEGRRPDTGILDINLYRDDLSLIADHPILRKTEIEFQVDSAKIVLIDDVLFTGRTVRIWAGRTGSSSRSWSTAVTARSRFGPTTWERTSRPRGSSR
jgi:pyrimidine operon attenuation protein/uracil phosphoribosyltransferase